jgi:hypothetical protein
MKGDVYGEACIAPYRNKAARLQLHLALFCGPANRVGASWVVLSSSARKCFHQPAIRLAGGEDASSASLGQSIRRTWLQARSIVALCRQGLVTNFEVIDGHYDAHSPCTPYHLYIGSARWTAG